jgi:ribose-phosphate pyrophosphokinase
VDDIIDSGGTIVEAAKALKSRGAGSINVGCIHPVLTGNADERILKLAEELVATNTIKTDYSKISVAPIIAEAIKKI